VNARGRYSQRTPATGHSCARSTGLPGHP
jgi:hypothetical protein